MSVLCLFFSSCDTRDVRQWDVDQPPLQHYPIQARGQSQPSSVVQRSTRKATLQVKKRVPAKQMCQIIILMPANSSTEIIQSHNFICFFLLVLQRLRQFCAVRKKIAPCHEKVFLLG